MEAVNTTAPPPSAARWGVKALVTAAAPKRFTSKAWRQVSGAAR